MKKKDEKTDYLIIGAGIMGLALAREIRSTRPGSTVTVIEKEPSSALHASGRNSGVLHAGFYYTADSLKARFTRDGNRFWQDYCRTRNLPINACGKVVVARTPEETEGIRELKRRGDKNGVDVRLIDEQELSDIEPNARTCGLALWSPNTASVDPVRIAKSLEQELAEGSIRFFYSTPYRKRLGEDTVLAGETVFSYGTLINTAGLYADRIARDFGFSEDTTILPFKGVYLEYVPDRTGEKPVRTNIYPVPDLKQPFLGVHFTLTSTGKVKIGPTAIPAFWRENYGGMAGFSVRDLGEILGWETRLFLGNDFGFRDLAMTEIRKYQKSFMARQAEDLVKKLDPSRFSRWGRPGIRAQLLDRKNRKLLSDFRVEGDRRSIHVLNAVSPAFTASVPFARWILERYQSGTGWHSEGDSL
jgi:L-2-hydroxyglutarate oxidase LhgO